MEETASPCRVIRCPNSRRPACSTPRFASSGAGARALSRICSGVEASYEELSSQVVTHSE